MRGSSELELVVVVSDQIVQYVVHGIDFVHLGRHQTVLITHGVTKCAPIGPEEVYDGLKWLR